MIFIYNSHYYFISYDDGVMLQPPECTQRTRSLLMFVLRCQDVCASQKLYQANVYQFYTIRSWPHGKFFSRFFSLTNRECSLRETQNSSKTLRVLEACFIACVPIKNTLVITAWYFKKYPRSHPCGQALQYAFLSFFLCFGS